MRITQNYNIQSLLNTIQNTRGRISDLQTQLATGKRINKISDDPENIQSVLRFTRMLKMHDNFKSNLSNALDFMAITSQSLDDAAGIFAQAKELTVQGLNSSEEPNWDSYAEQIDQMLNQLVDITNTRFKDRYVFGGTNTTSPPFVLAPDGSAVSANGDGVDGALNAEIGENMVRQYNVSGQAAFLDGVNVFQTLIDLRDAFQNGDVSGIQTLQPQIDQAAKQLYSMNSTVGARINHFEMFINQYESQDLKIEGNLSEIEDTDVAKAATELEMEQTGLTAALQVLAQTMNISLMDFLS